VSIRRLFWLGAAILFSVAALVAIAAVVRGHFGETTNLILLTCGLAFVCGSVALSGLACIDRGVVRVAAWAAVASGLTMFVVMDAIVWGMRVSSSAVARAIGILAVWMAVALIVTTLRLITTSPRLLGTLVPATWAAAGLAATLGTVMIIMEHPGSGLVKLEVVLAILMLLGYALAPVLQRFWAGAGLEPVGERLLGTIGGVDVLAVRGAGRSVTIGSGRTQLAASEGIVLREHT
jgi:hypothetical protein